MIKRDTMMKQKLPVAIALEYDEEKAPVVKAKGTGELAQRIIDIAEQNNIHLQEDKELIQILAELNLGDEIPEQLYKAVAEVIAFAYIIKGKFPKRFKA
ncbi:MAG: EscU/YscU/HrcU family type III secretion system export apparatus switch protein [Gammaproteobacteria bacterium]|nr:EscU/YscU/HrcU family type III secretion system export apparatus switch protein [Gammaproteobacteria bacterium]